MGKIRQVRTPGGRLVAHYVTKKAKFPGNGTIASTAKLAGLKRMRPTAYKTLSKHSRSVSRAYGGVLTHTETRMRIIRSFLIGEVQNVKKTMALAAASKKKKPVKRGGKQHGRR